MDCTSQQKALPAAGVGPAVRAISAHWRWRIKLLVTLLSDIRPIFLQVICRLSPILLLSITIYGLVVSIQMI